MKTLLFGATLIAAVLSPGGAPSAGAATRDFKGYYLFGRCGDAQTAADVTSGLVAGVGTVFSWRDLEPSYRRYDWSRLDACLRQVDSVGKNLILRVKVGRTNLADETKSTAPSWLWAPHGGRPGAQRFSYAEDGELWKIPVFWDPTWQQDWREFVRALGARYGQRTNIVVMVTGAYRAHGENWMPADGEAERELWVAEYRVFSDRPDATFEDVRNAFDGHLVQWLYPLFASAFTTNQPLAQGVGLGFKDRDVSHAVGHPLRHPHGLEQLLAARQAYGRTSRGSAQSRGFFVQSNSLSDRLNEMPTWVGVSWNRVDGKADRGVTGYQAYGATSPFCHSRFCLPWDRFDEMVANAVRWKASYIELYRSDVHAALNYTVYPRGTERRVAAEHIRKVLEENKRKLHSTLPCLGLTAPVCL